MRSWRIASCVAPPSRLSLVTTRGVSPLILGLPEDGTAPGCVRRASAGGTRLSHHRPSATAGSSAMPDLVDEIELGFQPVDVLFLGRHDAAGRDRGSRSRRTPRSRRWRSSSIGCAASSSFRSQLERLRRRPRRPRACAGPADWAALEKQDALDQAFGVLHLVDRGRALARGEPVEAPVAEHLRVHESTGRSL